MPATAIARAAEWLRERLKAGAVRVDELEKEARGEGISRATLYKASGRVQIKRRRLPGGTSEWVLIPAASQDSTLL